MNKEGNSLQKHEKNRFKSKLWVCFFFFFIICKQEEIIVTCFVKRWGTEMSLCKYSGKNGFCEKPICGCVDEKKCICMKNTLHLLGSNTARI